MQSDQSSAASADSSGASDRAPLGVSLVGLRLFILVGQHPDGGHEANEIHPAIFGRKLVDAALQTDLAIDETVIPLHPPLPLAGVSIVMERGCQQNDCLVRG